MNEHPSNTNYPTPEGFAAKLADVHRARALLDGCLYTTDHGIACEYYVLCDWPAAGTTTNVIGEVPTCWRCADKHGLTMNPYPTVGAECDVEPYGHCTITAVHPKGLVTVLANDGQYRGLTLTVLAPEVHVTGKGVPR